METMALIIVFVLIAITGYWYVTKAGEFLSGGTIRYDDYKEEK